MESQEQRPPSAATPPELQLRWWQRLGVKVLVVSAVITFGLVALFVLFTLRQQQRYMTQEVLRGAAQFSDTIKASTYHFMLADERESAYRTMEIDRAPRGHRARCGCSTRRGGSPSRPTSARLAGWWTSGPRPATSATPPGQPLVRLNIPSRSRIFAQNGHRVLAMITPIYNEPSCSTAACHAHPTRAAGARRRGRGDVAQGRGRGGGRRCAAQHAAAGGARRAGSRGPAVALFRPLATSSRPLGDLVAATEPHRAAATSTMRVAVRRTDEIGVLAGSFNAMTASLRQARGELAAS